LLQNDRGDANMQLPDAPRLADIYQLQVREYLDDELAVWFSPFTINHEPNAATTLTGAVRDQAELHGVLLKIRDLNLTLVFVVRQGDGPWLAPELRVLC
jgi:hypothetical protein